MIACSQLILAFFSHFEPADEQSPGGKRQIDIEDRAPADGFD